MNRRHDDDTPARADQRRGTRLGVALVVVVAVITYGCMWALGNR